MGRGGRTASSPSSRHVATLLSWVPPGVRNLLWRPLLMDVCSFPEAASSLPTISRRPRRLRLRSRRARPRRRWLRSSPSRRRRYLRPRPAAKWTGPTTPTSRATASATRSHAPPRPPVLAAAPSDDSPDDALIAGVVRGDGRLRQHGCKSRLPSPATRSLLPGGQREPGADVCHLARILGELAYLAKAPGGQSATREISIKGGGSCQQLAMNDRSMPMVSDC